MGLKENIENNVVVWLLGTLAVGFGAGFGAYGTILQVSDLTTITRAEKADLERAVSRVTEMETALDKLKGFQGAPPKAGNFVLTSGLSANRPVDRLSTARIGSDVVFFVQWVGLTPGGFYAQTWELRDNNGVLVHQFDYAFVPQENTHNVWHSLFLNPTLYAAGNYRVRVMLNGEQALETGITLGPSEGT